MNETPSNFRKQIELKDLELNALLEITQSINNNLPRESLYKIFNFTLRANLKLKKLALYVNDEKWACKVNFGTKNDFFSIDPTKYILSREGISDIEHLDPADPFSEFEKVIPVRHKAQLLGVVLLGGYDFEDYSNGEININFIEALSNIIIVAVENKKLARKELEQQAFLKELEIARNVQHFLFPKDLPHNENIKIYSSYLPHQMVGGDYFDYIPIDENNFLICIADVSGKGIPAALLMSNFQASLRTLIRQTTKLEKIIRELNFQILHNSNGESFITFFAALFNKKERYFKYVNAGHNPPVFHTDKTGFIHLELGSTVLGILDELPFLNVGKIRDIDNFFLFAYTDGLLETFNEEDEPFGSERITRIVKENINLDLSKLHEKVISEVNAYKGSREYNDDITLLSCRLNLVFVYLFRIPTLVKYYYNNAIWNGKRDGNNLYITFDDGPVPGSTDKILDILDQHGIKASFFCVGENIKKHPDLFRKILEQGHTVGNHTMHHLNGWKSNPADFLHDIALCEEEIDKHRLHTGLQFFRPPYGKIRKKMISDLSGKYHVIMWDVLSYDFDLHLDINTCLEKSIKYTKPGSIIIFHDSEKTINRTDFIISQYISHFKDLNYKFFTIDELILKDY